MEERQLSLPDLVQKTLLVPNLSEKKPWHEHVNWVDQLCSVVNLIPVAGGAIAGEIKSITDSISNYQASEFLRKFVTFVYELSDLEDAKRIDFLNEVEEKAQDASGNVLMSIIDRLDNINKQKIFANLVKAKCNGQISIEDFFRLESVLQRIPYVDLQQLPLYQNEYYDKHGDSELLYSTGVLRPSMFHQDGDTFVLSNLGVAFLKWGMGIEVEVPQIKGTSTGLSWEEIGEVPDVENVKAIVNKTIEERKYNEMDRPMFDYDVARGK